MSIFSTTLKQGFPYSPEFMTPKGKVEGYRVSFVEFSLSNDHNYLIKRALSSRSFQSH